MKVAEVMNIRREKLSKAGRRCAWKGCGERVDAEAELPPGWLWLITYWSPWPETDKTLLEVVMGSFCKRDAVICSWHAKELERLLEDIGPLDGPPAGAA